MQLFRKTEVGGWHFRFLVVFRGEISPFPKETVVFGLVWRLQQYSVGDQALGKELDSDVWSLRSSRVKGCREFPLEESPP